MALIKATTNEAGITGNYWRLVRVIPPTFNGGASSGGLGTGYGQVEGWGYGTLTFELYRDATARKDELRQPLKMIDVQVPGSFFMGLTLVADMDLVKKVIYDRKKKIPGFQDALKDYAPGEVPDDDPADEPEAPVVPPVAP